MMRYRRRGVNAHVQYSTFSFTPSQPCVINTAETLNVKPRREGERKARKISRKTDLFRHFKH